MRVAYQGEPGAYSEVAVCEHFGNEVEPVPCKAFEDVFEAVKREACDHGLIPIENSLAGSIHRNYDLLIEYPFWITGEHYLPIHHCLVGLPGATLAGLRRVISHPQALSQCDRTLRQMEGIEIEAAYDTAGSVKIVREQGDPSQAAVASRKAAELYGMQILAEAIEDNPANFTRFLAIAPEQANPGHEAKTSIVFSLKNQPGSLFRAMGVFALRDIDLTKIESRPIAGKPWEYLFYIDFAGSIREGVVKRALAHLKEYALLFRVLGSYPRHRI
jgi:prephenate dehydratase